MMLHAYRLALTTPAFLGNSSLQAQWRTPPIKALLRQWWRVAVAQEVSFNADSLRKAENDLFGVAADGGDSHQSLARLRLSHWNEGKLKDWPRHGTVRHPEVSAPVGSDLYLGFGPLLYDRDSRSTALKANAAIQAGDSATLSLAVPDQHASTIRTALTLMNLYGTLGGRSRNGWGSFSLTPADDNTPTLPSELNTALTQPWQDALRLDWPHAIGSDTRGALVWQTRPFADWPLLMQELARLKIGLRTQRFPLELDLSAGDKQLKNKRGEDAGIEHGKPQQRHWLSYPVTHHSVKAWGGNARLPNSMRFKVRPAPGDAQKLVGVIFHVPCKPPPAFNPDHASLVRVWQQVHTYLDAPDQQLTRSPA